MVGPCGSALRWGVGSGALPLSARGRSNWSPIGNLGRCVVPASVRSPKGLSFATVRPTRIHPLHALLILAALLAGCSERAARISGNERLIRGDDGLGTTGRRDTLVDRDTFVPPAGTTIRGTTLLVGQRNLFEARSLFR